MHIANYRKKFANNRDEKKHKHAEVHDIVMTQLYAACVDMVHTLQEELELFCCHQGSIPDCMLLG